MDYGNDHTSRRNGPESSPEWTHVAYCDESAYTHGRFRSLTALSLGRSDLASVNSTIICLLRDSSLREFSWKDLRGARERFAAEKLVDLVVDLALAGAVRMDAVIWDTQDSRHRVSRRDDVGNLGRMYHHLLRLVLGRRWPAGGCWLLRPDENDAVDWDAVDEFLRRKETNLGRTQPGLLTGDRRRYRLFAVRPADSAEEPLVQAADLFAGLAVFSRERCGAYARWRRERCGQGSLLPEDPVEMSRADGFRFLVLDHLRAKCREARLPISLDSTKGLVTRSPRCALNFWPYVPQSPLDRAPAKSRRPR